MLYIDKGDKGNKAVLPWLSLSPQGPVLRKARNNYFTKRRNILFVSFVLFASAKKLQFCTALFHYVDGLDD